MRALRHFLREHVAAAWVLLALVLAMKLLVPAGFMPVVSSNGVMVVMCPGVQPASAMPGMAMPGHHDGGHEQPRPDSPCAFAGLTAPTLGGADPLQLAIALVAIVAASLFFAPIERLARIPFLRPPLRGPPSHA